MLSADDPFACIDLDGKGPKATLEQMQLFQLIVNSFDSYSEFFAQRARYACLGPGKDRQRLPAST